MKQEQNLDWRCLGYLFKQMYVVVFNIFSLCVLFMTYFNSVCTLLFDQHVTIDRNLGNPKTDPTTNGKIYPLDYDRANTNDAMRDLIERMIAIDVNIDIDGDKILCHPIFHLEKMKRSKEKQRHRHRHHHHRSQSTRIISTQIKENPRLSKIKSTPLPTAAPTSTSTSEIKTVKKQNKTTTPKTKTMKKSSNDTETQVTFANNTRQTRTQCYVVKPTLEIIYE